MIDQLLLIIGGALAVAVGQLVTRIFDNRNVRELTRECKAARDDLYEQVNKLAEDRRELVDCRVKVELLESRVRALEQSIT